jgi:5-(carboxyamino)imidazole ribonucleotide synthase
MCVEFFVLEDDTLIVNEMAPRPHNSGHYTLDACDQSQFDLQVHTLAGLPLVQPHLYCPAIMLNLLGDIWQSFDDAPPWDKVLTLPGTHLHLYGKLKASRGRKMGHLNITGASVAEVRATAIKAAELLRLAPF